VRPDRGVGGALVGGMLLFALLAAVSVLYASGGGGSDERLVIVMLINVVLVLSLQIFIGNTGVLSFGHMIFPALGGYVAGFLGTPALVRGLSISEPPFGLADVSTSFLVAVTIGGVVAAVAAAVLGIAVTRLSGLGAAILSLALLVVVHQVLTNWTALTGGANGMYGIPVETSLVRALGAALVAILVARLFKDSGAGLWAQAAREDELAAAAMGVNVTRSRYVAWVISAAIGGLGGALLGSYLGAISPDEFYIDLTFTILAFLILGGMRSVSGVVAGTVLLSAVLEVARRLADGPVVAGVDLPEINGLSQLVLGAAIIAVMVLRPEGLLGDRELDELLGPVRRRSARRVEEPDHGAAVSQRGSTPAAVPAATGRLLSAANVGKSFAGITALHDVSIDVARGQIVGVIGPNGAGKTTLLNLLSGNLTPTHGTIEFEGRQIEGVSPTRIARLGMARTFQNLRLFEGLSVRDNVQVAVAVGARYRRNVERLPASVVLEAFALGARASEPAQALAQGDRRRLEMARASALSPSLLLLDEPTAGMNDLEAEDLLARIRDVRSRFGCGVVVVDHNVPFIMDLCERIHVVNGGREIARGAPEEIAEHPEVIEAYLGIREADRAPAASDDAPLQR
jgi:branched-chain amino acid transport system permease protein